MGLRFKATQRECRELRHLLSALVTDSPTRWLTLCQKTEVHLSLCLRKSRSTLFTSPGFFRTCVSQRKLTNAHALAQVSTKQCHPMFTTCTHTHSLSLSLSLLTEFMITGLSPIFLLSWSLSRSTLPWSSTGTTFAFWAHEQRHEMFRHGLAHDCCGQ